MFQQLKAVYETEVEMVKVEEEKKVKRSMATHALQLQKRRDEVMFVPRYCIGVDHITLHWNRRR